LKTTQRFWSFLLTAALLLGALTAGALAGSFGGFGPAQGGGGGGGGSVTNLQTAYAGGNTIATAGLTVSLSDTLTDAVNVLTLAKSPGAASNGSALQVNTNSNVNGSAVVVTHHGQGHALSVSADSGAACFEAAPSNGGSGFLALGATETSSAPLFQGSQTWNSSGTSFKAMVLNVTNTASAAGSRLLALQVGGTGQFGVSPLGSVICNDSGSNLAQNATDGFTYLPRCATGAPSGTPTSVTGAAALVVGGDHHLYAELTSGSFTQVDGGGGTTLDQVIVNGSTATHSPTFNGSSSSNGGRVGVGHASPNVTRAAAQSVVTIEGTSGGSGSNASGVLELGNEAGSGFASQTFIGRMDWVRGGTVYGLIGGCLDAAGDVPSLQLLFYSGNPSSGASDTVAIQSNGDMVVAGTTNRYCFNRSSGADEGQGLPDTAMSSPSAGVFAFGHTSASDAAMQFGSLAKLGSIVTAGDGLVSVLGAATITAQSGAHTIATYSPGSGTHTYEVSGSINITAATSAVFPLQVTYTDTAGASHTTNIPLVNATSGTGTVLTTTNSSAAADYVSIPLHIVATSGSAITVSTGTGTYTGVTYSANATIRRMQ
jgi:hypothetical protein